MRNVSKLIEAGDVNERLSYAGFYFGAKLLSRDSCGDVWNTWKWF